ncbi:MAG: S-layer protein [Candidatus Methanofastidiosa archaeon]|nr:S-layer protein [Candidatus Methanofastidiosa archaeon]
MKLRTIGAVLAGAALIGASIAGAATDVPAKSWWIDPATGQPNVEIIVGAQANAADVVSASFIATAIGNMATVEEELITKKTASVKWEHVGEYKDASLAVDYNVSPECADGTHLKAKWYLGYELYSSLAWETAENNWPNKNYDTYVQLAMPSDVRNPAGSVVAKGLSTLWFSNSPKEWDSKDRIYKFSVISATGNTRSYFLVNTKTTFSNDPTFPIVETLPAYAGGSYDNGDGSWDFNTYGFFTTKAWVSVAGDLDAYSATDDCDYIFGGTGTAMEAHEEIQIIVQDKYDSDSGPEGILDLIGDQGSVSGIVYRTAEIRYPLLENGQNVCGIKNCWGMIDFQTAKAGYQSEIKFLGKMYHPMFAGATWTNTVEGMEYYLGAYFMYGKAYAESERIMRVGDVYNFHGWTVTLNDVNIYENKAFVQVTGPTLTEPFGFIMVMDSLEACGPCCPECATYGGGGAFTSNPTQRNEYDPYVRYTTVTKEKSGYSYDFFRYVNFMLDGIKTFVGADGTYLAEFNLYAIEDYGYLEDKGCCDPFVTTPNDYGLAITGGWRRIKILNYEGRENVPDVVVIANAWEDVDLALVTDAYILWQPAPRCSIYCPDANYDTLELQLCDTINIPDCETNYVINGPENYFTVEILDLDFGKYNTGDTFDPVIVDSIAPTLYGPFKAPQSPAPGPASLTDATIFGIPGFYVGQHISNMADSDGVYLKINMSTRGDVIKYPANVRIDPVELIKLDIEINTTTNTKNLILVGGPVYNDIVKDLVNMGISTVDWASSPGEWEWITDPFGRGYDVLIVAGANREETRMATEALIRML